MGKPAKGITPEKKERRHVMIPRYLDKKVTESANRNGLNYSQQITMILRGIYGEGT